MAAAEQTPTSGENIPVTLAPHGTSYVVLRAHDDGLWGKLGEARTANPDAAIRKVAGDKEGTFIAVPKRSWNPRTLSVEQITRAKLT